MKKYQRQFLDKETVEGHESADLHFGTALHAALYACLSGNDPLIVFSLYWETVKGLDMAFSRQDWGQLKTLGEEVFIPRFVARHAKHYQPVSMEQMLRAEIGGHPFEGTPDFVGLYKGIPSVVDFKTSNYAYPKEKIISNEQMPIYAELARLSLGYEAQQLVYQVFIKSEARIQTIIEPLTKPLLDNTVKNAIIMCNMLKDLKEFPKNPTACRMGQTVCPYFSKCYGGTSE